MKIIHNILNKVPTTSELPLIGIINYNQNYQLSLSELPPKNVANSNVDNSEAFYRNFHLLVWSRNQSTLFLIGFHPIKIGPAVQFPIIVNFESESKRSDTIKNSFVISRYHPCTYIA